MATKIHGVRTGTIDGFADNGWRVKWIPKSELILISSDDTALDRVQFGYPRSIAANPSTDQAFEELYSGDRKQIKDAARLFVGFNVGNKKVWRAGEVYLMCYLLREEQLSGGKGYPAFSFYVGCGAFPGDKIVVSERSAQLVFMNFGQKTYDFSKDMFKLAEKLGEALSQESILVEIQSEGETVYLDYIETSSLLWLDVDDAKVGLEENKDLLEPKIWRME